MSVYKKSGRWYANFMINKKRYHIALKGPSDYKQAAKMETKLKSEIGDGNYGFLNQIKKAETISLSKMIEIYLEYSKLNKKSVANDKFTCEYFKKLIGNKLISEIKPLDIEAYKTFRSDNKIKPSSINRELNSISKMFSIAVENEFIKDNPCKKVKKLRVDEKKIRFLTKEEQEKLFKAIKKDEEFMRPIILMALYTGMRKSEILNLTWGCVDLDSGYIDVLKTKNAKARQIPIAKKLHKELHKIKTYELPKEKLERLEKRGVELDKEHVFVNQVTQKPYTDVKKQFKVIIDNAEIKDFTFHDLRHTAATRMVENGIDLVVVQEILGHLHISTTMIYAHPVPERKMKAIQALNKY